MRSFVLSFYVWLQQLRLPVLHHEIDIPVTSGEEHFLVI